MNLIRSKIDDCRACEYVDYAAKGIIGKKKLIGFSRRFDIIGRFRRISEIDSKKFSYFELNTGNIAEIYGGYIKGNAALIDFLHQFDCGHFGSAHAVGINIGTHTIALCREPLDEDKVRTCFNAGRKH